MKTAKLKSISANNFLDNYKKSENSKWYLVTHSALQGPAQLLKKDIRNSRIWKSKSLFQKKASKVRKNKKYKIYVL